MNFPESRCVILVDYESTMISHHPNKEWREKDNVMSNFTCKKNRCQIKHPSLPKKVENMKFKTN